ncbi:carbohydrate sulfotransferase 11-like isoform X1 [Venturia canescens]|uniref:carbohydrate sulfotransferase 11-like isoform X1 n=1 Tax=Venturia canescens TaxID=32260 RepID=UPI001C9CF2F1|nr:carbohydrate sulfotransferase 11-like [Venturia canescens]
MLDRNTCCFLIISLSPSLTPAIEALHRKHLIFLLSPWKRQKNHFSVSTSMYPTSKLVKYFLIVVIHILAFYLVLFFFINYKNGDQTVLLEINDNSETLEFDSSISESFFYFEEQSIVEFENLEVGGLVTTEKLQQKFRRVFDICDKYNLTESLRKKHFFYSPKHEALYCWIRKVASTSFTKFFSELRGRKVVRNYYREIDYLAPKSIDELKRIINNTRAFKFLVVRHPFQRLVSSYRDRIEDNSRFTAQAWIYVPRIFRVTRPELFRSNGSEGNGLQRIFDSHKRLKLVPSFKEFIVWLLNQPSEKEDDHWSQYHKQCSICNVNFDYILNLDNYTINDVTYIFKRLQLDEKRAYLPKIQSSRGGKSDFARTCEYFNELSRTLVIRLYERYKIDFEMFGYRHEDYVKCCGEVDCGIVKDK